MAGNRAITMAATVATKDMTLDIKERNFEVFMVESPQGCVSSQPMQCTLRASLRKV
jgi:hypothetical protein